MSSKSTFTESSTKDKIEGHSLDHLFKTSEKVVQAKTAHSVVLDVETEKRIPKFDAKELTVGRVLGRGGFCVVNEITKITLVTPEASGSAAAAVKKTKVDADDEFQIHNIVQDRSFMEKYCIRKGKDARYAIKKLQNSSRKDAHTFVSGIVDLAIEARFLSVIRHANIIKMRAMASGSRYDTTFFVILDRLYDILTTRLIKWKRRQPNTFTKLIDRGGKREKAFWVERLTYAYDLACALKYLHDTRIVYRDIKPDNIGFDVRDDIKIFDFGLAKELDPKMKLEDGTYKLTGDTGSLRYMACEVALSKPYNETCDVYSFCILLWQILQLENPFEFYTMSLFDKNVVRGGVRPKCDPKWPKPLQTTLNLGWGETISARPSMGEVVTMLQKEITRNTGEGILEALDASQKSAMSLHLTQSQS